MNKDTLKMFSVCVATNRSLRFSVCTTSVVRTFYFYDERPEIALFFDKPSKQPNERKYSIAKKVL